MHPDHKYIQALLTNNHVVLKELYSRFFEKIRLMVCRNGGTNNDAADVMQDSLLSIYNHVVSGQFELTCPMEAFLYHVSRNKWITELRKRNKSNKVTFTDTPGYTISEDSFGEAELCIQQHEQKKLFEQKLGELGQSCKELLQMNWSGKAPDEVAKALNVSYDFVRKKKGQCIKQLILLIEQSPEYKYLK